MLDLYGCKPGVCDDLSLCYQFLDDIVAELGMEKQSPPSIFRSDEKRFPDKAGLSGWAPLIESSVVIHTLSPKNYISIDVYCCRCFDIERAKAVCRHFFSPAKIDAQYMERGLDYYKEEGTYHSLTVNSSAPDAPEVLLEKKDVRFAVK